MSEEFDPEAELGSDEVGYVSSWRPLLTLAFHSGDKKRIVLVDTGCNLAVVLLDTSLVDEIQDPRSPGEWFEQGTVADGAAATFKVFWGRLTFMKISRKVPVFVPISTEDRPLPPTKPFLTGDPVALIGSELLKTTRLVVDYAEGSVRVANAV